MTTNKPIWRCTWCIKDTETKRCEHCGNSWSVQDRTQPHTPEWSRKTIRTVECKICDREVLYENHGLAGDMCDPQNEKC